MERRTVGSLEDVLTMKQVHYILQQAVGEGRQLAGSKVERAAQGLSGFLGDHFRITLDVRECAKQVKLFVKRMPLANGPKAKFIDENNYYKREKIVYQLFDKLSTDDENPWYAPAYICNDSILVMPDLQCLGYRQCPTLDCLDLQHTLLVTASIARFHAAFANYETKRVLDGHLPFSQEHADLLKDPTFCDSPWIRAAAKLTKNFLNAFSDRCNQHPTDLEEILAKLYIEACESLTESNSLNVVIHKDLWANNIMFKYEGNVPVNALLIDFQCIRYGPPAFDLMIFLYLNTSRSFRKKHEATIFRHYYIIFSDNIDEKTRARLQVKGYDFDVFVGWCHKARMFGMLETITIFPYVLMEPSEAQQTFDDPETYMEYCDEDRTAPVLAHARRSAPYRLRQLEVCEEFLDRYVFQQISH